jgi:hypothetical protein
LTSSLSSRPPSLIEIHDNQVNGLPDRAKTWDTLNEPQKEEIITGTLFNADRTHDLVRFSTHCIIGAVTLLQHPLLYTCSSARMELLQTFYKESTFLCDFDFGADEFNQPVLDTALRHLGPTRCSALFAASNRAAQHIFIAFHNLDSEMTVHGIYQWVSLFLDGSLSRGRLSRPGHFANWGFEREIKEEEPTERESALETFVIGLQAQGMRIGSIAPAQRGDCRREVLQWVADYDRDADWRLEDDDIVERRNFVRAKQVVGSMTNHRLQRMAKK